MNAAKLCGRVPNGFSLLGRVALVLVTCQLMAVAARVPGGAEELRRLLRLPTVSFTTGVAFDISGSLEMLGATPSPEEITAARRSVREQPADGESRLRLGQLVSRMRGERSQIAAEAEAAYSNAVARLRTQVEQRPQDGLLLARLGEALDQTHQHEEAESVLRRAVRTAPADGETWLGLGTCLNRRVLPALLPEEGGKTLQGDLMAMTQFLIKHPPTAEQFDRAGCLQDEAMECFERAAALASNNPVGFEKRAGCRMAGSLMARIRQNASSPQADSAAYMAVFFSMDYVPDLRRAADLDPDNAPRVAAVAIYEIIAQTLHRAGGRMRDVTWESFRETIAADAAESIRWKMERLSQLTESPRKNQAAQAAELLGCIRMLGLRDFRGAEAAFRRALALDPRRDQSWDGLMAVLVAADRNEAYLQAAKERLERQPSARNQVLVAKACERMDRHAEAIEHARTAVQLEPRQFLPHATLAVALMQHEDSPGALQEAASHLKRAIALMAEATEEQRLQIRFATGVFVALTGEPAEARQHFRAVLEVDPENKEAKAALGIVASR